MVGAGPNVSRARKLCNKLDDCEECSFYVRVREGLALRVRLIIKLTEVLVGSARGLPRRRN